MTFKLFANTVRNNFVPVDFCSHYWQLPSQRLKGGVGHRLIVFRDCRLIIVLRLLDKPYQVLRRLLLAGDWQAFLHLLATDQLYIPILVVVHLYFETTFQFGVSRARGKTYGPYRTPATVPKVFRLKLMIFYARC